MVNFKGGWMLKMATRFFIASDNLFRIGIGLLLALNCTAQSFQYLPDIQPVDLKPQMRAEPLSAILYSLQSSDISMFLENVLIYDSKDQFETLPYVVGFDRNKTTGGPGDIAYAMGLNVKNDISSYSLLVPGRVISHPDTGEKIGLEANVIGSAILQKAGVPQTVLIVNSETSIETNTRLIPAVGIDLPVLINVRYPDKMLSGYILSIQVGANIGGPFDTAIVSLGRRDGIEQGHILDLTEGERELTDENTYKTVKLPTTKFGEIIIYQVKDKISLGIITYSERVVVANDIVVVPAQVVNVANKK